MKATIAITTALIIGLSLNMNAQATHPKSEVGQRQENQHDRIKQGEKSGELTHKEAKNLHQDERSIHNEIKADRQQNGGKLTPEQRKLVNRQQNQESRKIYRDKHNGAEQPRAK